MDKGMMGLPSDPLPSSIVASALSPSPGVVAVTSNTSAVFSFQDVLVMVLSAFLNPPDLRHRFCGGLAMQFTPLRGAHT